MPNTPHIAVLLPVHNGMPYLPTAVQSILQQTFAPLELLLLDDGSSDDTPRYAASLGDPRVHYHRLPQVGFCEALNHGLRQATGPLVARMDADDLSEPQRLAEQYQYLRDHPDCLILGCQSTEIDPEGNPQGERRFPKTDTAIRWQMAFGCPFQHPGVVYRREAILACGGYVSEEWPAEDYALWVRLATRGKMANLPQFLLRYRVHPQSVSALRVETQTAQSAHWAAVFAHAVLPELDTVLWRELYQWLALGGELQEVSPNQLADAVELWRCRFQPERGTNADLDSWMQQIERRLRWRCLERAEAAWQRPLTAWRWLRLARRFDPLRGSLVSIAARSLQRLPQTWARLAT